MSNICHQGYNIASYPVCSRHGVCISDKCLCHPGWTSLSDFALDEGYDCDINKSLVLIWSCINFALTTIGFLVIVCCLFRDKMLSYPKRFKLKSLCNYCFMVTNIGGMMYTAGKTVDLEYYIVGKSAISTIGGVLVVLGTIYGISAFFVIMINFLNNYSRLLDPATRHRIQSNVGVLVQLAPIVPTVLGACFVSEVTSFSLVPAPWRDTALILLCSTFTIAYTYYAVIVIYVIQVFLRVMKSFIDNSTTSSPLVTSSHANKPSVPIKTIPPKKSNVKEIMIIYKKTAILNRVLTPFLLSGAPLNIIFSAWLLLRRKMVLILMLQLTLVSLAASLLSWSLASVRGSNEERPKDGRISCVSNLADRGSLAHGSHHKFRTNIVSLPNHSKKVSTSHSNRHREVLVVSKRDSAV